MGNRSLCHIAVAVSALCLLPERVIAVNEDRLWLPVKYHKLYLDLKESAEAAEQLDVCVEVLKGGLDLEQSKKNKPIFRIQCRKANGRSYNEMVDGTTKKTLTTRPQVFVELTEAEKEKKVSQLLGLCYTRFQKSTELMIDLELLTPSNPEPLSYDNEQAKFQWDFDARGVSGEKLRYRAECSATLELPPELTIKPRRPQN